MSGPRYFVIQGCDGAPEDALDRVTRLHGGVVGTPVLFDSPAKEATYGAIEIPAPEPAEP